MNIRGTAQTVFWISLAVGALCYQTNRLIGESQRSERIGFIKGYERGRDTMIKEYGDQLIAIKHAKKLYRAGFEIVDPNDR